MDYSKISALVVDDEAVIRMVTASFLRQLGIMDVFQAENGKDGLTILEEQKKEKRKIGLIISDLDMPEMSGLDLLKYVKVDKKNIPFVVMTGGGIERISEAVKLGAAGGLQKPFRLDEFKKVIESVL